MLEAGKMVDFDADEENENHVLTNEKLMAVWPLSMRRARRIQFPDSGT